jgi:hypothetical protein
MSIITSFPNHNVSKNGYLLFHRVITGKDPTSDTLWFWRQPGTLYDVQNTSQEGISLEETVEINRDHSSVQDFYKLIICLLPHRLNVKKKVKLS